MKNHSKDEPYIEYGKRIRSERKAAGFTSAESFGLRLNIGRSQVEQIEQGKRLPALDTLVKMAEIFNCEVGYLLCEPGYECRTRTKTDIQRETGLSEKAVDYICTLKNEPHKIEILNRLILSEYFPVMLKQLEAAVECKESTYVKFIGEYADTMQKLICSLEKMSKTKHIEEYEPKTLLRLNGSSFDKGMSGLSKLAPNMTALSRSDAVKFYLQEAQHSFRQAAEDAI